MIGTKVLLVDDEKVFTDNMSRLLEARGYVVTVAGNGERAVRALQGAGYDVVVLDLKMPGKDGLATLEEIKRLGLLTETLILTGHGSIDSALAALKLGAYDYLTKPCEVGDLAAKIEGAWRKKDEARMKELEDKTKKIVESPRSALEMGPRKGRR
ncbi:MAG TPA: response regulator [bacterium]|nr:response regulator [bacterium]